MSKNKGLVIANTITFALMLFVNYASNAGIFNGATVSEISHKYDTLFAPAGYAFSIWSLIFLLCIGFVAYQWKLLKLGDPKRYIQRTGVWFIVSNITNASWILLWTNDLIGWSVVAIVLLLFSLCVLTVHLRLELDDEPVRTIFFVWWPIVYYLGWLMVATIACISSWLVSIGSKIAAPGEDVWTMLLIAIATILYILLVKNRNLREAAAVGIWAFVAIAVRQWNAYNNIVITAIVCSVILFGAVLYHGYKNRYYGPAEKIKRGGVEVG